MFTLVKENKYLTLVNATGQCLVKPLNSPLYFQVSIIIIRSVLGQLKIELNSPSMIHTRHNLHYYSCTITSDQHLNMGYQALLRVINFTSPLLNITSLTKQLLINYFTALHSLYSPYYNSLYIRSLTKLNRLHRAPVKLFN